MTEESPLSPYANTYVSVINALGMSFSQKMDQSKGVEFRTDYMRAVEQQLMGCCMKTN